MSIMKGTVSMSLTDTNQNTYIKNLPNVNPAYLPMYNVQVAESDVAKVKTACIALMNLSDDTLGNITLSVSMDITDTESIQGGENNG